MEHYHYWVKFSEEDSQFVALVKEFPSLSWLADSEAEAMSGLRSLVQTVLDDMIDSGETPPEPIDE